MDDLRGKTGTWELGVAKKAYVYRHILLEKVAFSLGE